jgi:hypothetical protein
VPDPYADHYKTALEGQKTRIVHLANQVLTFLHSAKDPNSKQKFKDACAHLREAISAAQQGLFSPKAPNAILSAMDSPVARIESSPEQSGFIAQLVRMMDQVPHIPHGNQALEDKLKQLVTHDELQEKIDQLDGKIKRLRDDFSKDIDFKLMSEIQSLLEALLDARKKSLLEVFATSGGIAAVIGGAAAAFTGPIAPILVGIMQTAFEIHSWAHDKEDDCMRSFLDDLNVRMPSGKSLLDRSDFRPELPA